MRTFDLYFAGKLMSNTDLQQAKAAVGRIFKLDEQALGKLFSGNKVRLKQAVDVDTANRYRRAFGEAGALIEVVPHAAKTPAQPLADARVASERPTETRPTLETTGPSRGADMTLQPPRTGSLEDCAREDTGFRMPDIDRMQLDGPADNLDLTPDPPPYRVDISNLSLADANTGSLEDCARPKAPRPIPDISWLSMSEANTGSLEDCHYQKPGRAIPDTSHLRLVSPDPEA